MDKLEIQVVEFEEALRCKGWCHSKSELRCKGWCHDYSGSYSSLNLPDTEYFS